MQKVRRGSGDNLQTDGKWPKGFIKNDFAGRVKFSHVFFRTQNPKEAANDGGCGQKRRPAAG